MSEHDTELPQAVIFTVPNRHVSDAGTPPQFEGGRQGMYHSYFENEYGEQLIFIYTYATKEGKLYHGDAGWDHPVPVIKGMAPSMVLNDPEKDWLKACWGAVSASEKLRGQRE